MAKNPEYSREERPINQKQGPRVGNDSRGDKRATFIREKTTGWREQLADTVMSALEKRDPRDYIDARTEPLDANRGPKSNPTAGGTKYNVKAKRPGKVS